MAKTIEERAVIALESIAVSFRTIEDTLDDLDVPIWSERLEWYLNEFYTIAKTESRGVSERPSLNRVTERELASREPGDNREVQVVQGTEGPKPQEYSEKPPEKITVYEEPEIVPDFVPTHTFQNEDDMRDDE
tara:strand:- start:4716 stop:5114 length:399 start_codon:yes stop_codon:yes gene_type:complete